MDILTLQSCTISFFINHNIAYVHIEGQLDLDATAQLRQELQSKLGTHYDDCAFVYDLRSWDSIHLNAVKRIRENMKLDVEMNNRCYIIINNDSDFEFTASAKMLVQDAESRKKVLSARNIDDAVDHLNKMNFDTIEFMKEYHQNRL